MNKNNSKDGYDGVVEAAISDSGKTNHCDQAGHASSRFFSSWLSVVTAYDDLSLQVLQFLNDSCTPE